LPTPPPEGIPAKYPNILGAIVNIKATNCYQDAQTGENVAASQSYTQVVIFVEQVVALQDKIAILHLHINKPRQYSSSYDKKGKKNDDEESEEGEGCCPGLKDQPCVYFSCHSSYQNLAGLPQER
ncbi:hypothetical protein DSO57_1034093, partial [Entomophthora muscae]